MTMFKHARNADKYNLSMLTDGELRKSALHHSVSCADYGAQIALLQTRRRANKRMLVAIQAEMHDRGME